MSFTAAGGERVSQVGARLGASFIYASQCYLVKWTDANVECTWTLDSTVTCVASDGSEKLYAGTQNGSVYKLSLDSSTEKVFENEKSITCLYVGSVVLIGTSGGHVHKLGSDLTLRPNVRFYPLCVVYNKDFDIVALSGTSSSIFLIQLSNPSSYVELPGHENWVKSLDFCTVGDTLVLASGGQDKYIRLWRITEETLQTDLLKSNLTTTVFKISENLNCVFDALLIGHDDWVVSVKWQPGPNPQLLSASGDSSLIIWSSNMAQETDDDTDMWTPTTRLGDVSIMGASTATGATGGFWTAEWLNASTIATLSRTGSWRLWHHDGSEWVSKDAITGHTKKVTGAVWFGESLVTTSLDQTTRLWSQLKNGQFIELNRPQIHGYDMNCVAALDSRTIVTGGDEKIMRVFTAPNVYHDLVKNFTNEKPVSNDRAMAAATVPSLGLSNKATETTDDVFDATVLPQEQQLQRLTLWPETDKIFGHGYELACVDVSSNGEYIASCCRANSARNAIVRIYTTNKFRQLEPLVGDHTLTINRIKFSPDSRHLVSVSRDRQWALYDIEEMKVVKNLARAHSRIIWDCCWLSNEQFVTVSRDKTVKVWNLNGECSATVTLEEPVTACAASNGRLFIGLESGKIHELKDLAVCWTVKVEGRPNQISLSDKFIGVACDLVRIIELP